MKNSKKLFLIVLSVLAVAFVSCKDKGTDPTPFKVSSIVGTWNGEMEGYTFTISEAGIINYVDYYSGEITNWATDKDTEKTEYKVNATLYLGGDTSAASILVNLTFTSSTSCTATIAEGDMKFTK